MQRFKNILLAGTIAGLAAVSFAADPPRPAPAGATAKESAPPAASKDYIKSAVYTRLMAFDKNGDGQLTKDEITDSRLMRLFERADANKDGVVTKDELLALAAKLDAESPQRGRRGGGDGGPGAAGPGGPPPGDGQGGNGNAPEARQGRPGMERRGPGGRGGPPQPGVVLSPGLQEALELTPEQKEKVEALQKEVDTKLSAILTDDQNQKLKEMRQRGPRQGPPEGGQQRRTPGE